MAQTVHLFLELVNGGKLEGESTVSSLDRGLSIECASYSYGVNAPKEQSTGMLTGRRQHTPVVIQKRLDATTPLLLKALCENDKIKTAEFRFYRPSLGGEGNEENYYTVKLQSGFVSQINQHSADAIMSGSNAPSAMEEIHFTFDTITWEYNKPGGGSVPHTDSWSGETATA